MDRRHVRDTTLAIVEKARGGEYAIDFPGRFGARPYCWHDGDEWRLFSLGRVPDAQYGQGEGRVVHTVALADRPFSEAAVALEVRSAVSAEYGGRVKVRPVDQTPVVERDEIPDRVEVAARERVRAMEVAD
jgi:hypothetical protein